MSEYTGRYHLMDCDKWLELFDSSLLIDCWNRISANHQVITNDDGEIVAGHADMLDYVMQTPKVNISELKEVYHGK